MANKKRGWILAQNTNLRLKVERSGLGTKLP